MASVLSSQSQTEGRFETGGELERVKRVWILGSGFSKPLGGPLLTDLLSPGFQARINAQHGEHPLWKKFHQIYPFFRAGVKNGHFEHAEDFLVQLDDESKVNTKRLTAILSNSLNSLVPYVKDRFSLPELREAAKHLVAAECSMHVPDGNIDHESFIPYRAWAETLTNEDAIISFNYDTLVEHLRPDELLRVVGPQDPRSHSVETMNRQTWLFKMHGSVDWFSEDPLQNTRSVSRSRVWGSDVPPVIGIPGTGKLHLSRSPLFEDIWGFASVALRHAEEIHLIGYSMPASDSYAISFILRQLQRNVKGGLLINLVLGQPGFVTERLRQVISLALLDRLNVDELNEIEANYDRLRPEMGTAMRQINLERRRFKVLVWAAYAQDYLVARSRDPDGEAVP